MHVRHQIDPGNLLSHQCKLEEKVMDAGDVTGRD